MLHYHDVVFLLLPDCGVAGQLLFVCVVLPPHEQAIRQHTCSLAFQATHPHEVVISRQMFADRSGIILLDNAGARIATNYYVSELKDAKSQAAFEKKLFAKMSKDGMPASHSVCFCWPLPHRRN